MSQIHQQTRTTPRTRAEIKASASPLSELAERYNITKATALKWKLRETTLKHYLATYNHRIPQKALNHLSPVQALKQFMPRLITTTAVDSRN